MSYWTSTGPRATQQQQQRQQQRSRVVNSACSDHAVIPKHLSAISSPVIPTHPSVISAHQAPLYQLPGALSCRNPVVSPPPSTLVRRELSSPVDFSLPSGGLSAAPQHPPPEVDQHQQRHHSGRCLSVPMDNTPSESFFSSDSTYFFGAPGTNLEEEESPRSPPQQQQQQHQEEDDEAVDSLLNPLQFFLSSLVDGDDEDDVRPEENRTLSASDDGKSDPVGKEQLHARLVPWTYPSPLQAPRWRLLPMCRWCCARRPDLSRTTRFASAPCCCRNPHTYCCYFRAVLRLPVSRSRRRRCHRRREASTRCARSSCRASADTASTVAICTSSAPVALSAALRSRSTNSRNNRHAPTSMLSVRFLLRLLHQHMMQCQEMTLVAEERRASAEVKCGICFDL